jgi:hypothetical protein
MAKDELANLRNFLKGLESPLTKLRHAGKDIKLREITVLKREIAQLEVLLVDLRRS